jgi:hypothetical protein
MGVATQKGMEGSTLKNREIRKPALQDHRHVQLRVLIPV